MSRRKISSEEWENIKKKLIASDLVTKRITLDSIELDENSVKDRRIYVKGDPIPVASTFFKSLGKILNVNVSLSKVFEKNNDNNFHAILINAIKKYITARGKHDEFLLVADPQMKRIVDITPPSTGRLSLATVCDVTEQLLNDHPYLTLETVDSSYGKTKFNFLNEDDVAFPNAGKDEVFKFGFTLMVTPKSTELSSYNQRLICTNGMTDDLGGDGGDFGGGGGPFFDGSRGGGNGNGAGLSLRGASKDEVRAFFQGLEQYKKTRFVPNSFHSTLVKAIGTKASLAEVEAALKKSWGALDIPEHDLLKSHKEAIARDYYPGYGLTLDRLKKQGKDPKDFNVNQKGFIKTGMSVWDVINSMTFLGSNNSGHQMNAHHKSELKADAGKLFAKGKPKAIGFDQEFAKFAQL